MLLGLCFRNSTGRQGMDSERILATYRIETPLPLEQAAAVMAGEQSTGTFVRVPGETDDLRERFGARVERIDGTRVGRSRRACPAAGRPRRRRPAALPQGRGGPLVPAGEHGPVAAEPAGHRGGQPVRAARVLRPAAARPRTAPGLSPTPTPARSSASRAPARLRGVEGRPLIGTIIKPSVGLSPEETAALVRTLVEAGIDFIKDDELMADRPALAPSTRGSTAVMRVIDDARRAHRQEA